MLSTGCASYSGIEAPPVFQSDAGTVHKALSRPRSSFQTLLTSSTSVLVHTSEWAITIVWIHASYSSHHHKPGYMSLTHGQFSPCLSSHRASHRMDFWWLQCLHPSTFVPSKEVPLRSAAPNDDLCLCSSPAPRCFAWIPFLQHRWDLSFDTKLGLQLVNFPISQETRVVPALQIWGHGFEPPAPSYNIETWLVLL